MTTLETASTEEAKQHSLHALVSTRPAAIIVFVFLVLVCLYGLSTFVILYRQQSEMGVRFIDDRAGTLLLFAPLFRSLGAMLLALDLRQYLISLGAIQRNESDAQEKIDQSDPILVDDSLNYCCVSSSP